MYRNLCTLLYEPVDSSSESEVGESEVEEIVEDLAEGAEDLL